MQRGRLLAIRDLVDPGELLDPARIEALVTAAGDVAALDTDLALALLWRAGSRCWWGGAPPELRLPVAAAAERLAPRTTTCGSGNPRLREPIDAAPTSWTAWHVLADPHGRRDAAPPRRHRAGPRRLPRELAPLGMRRELYRERGMLGVLSRLLISGAFARCWTGEWETAAADLEEGRALAAETGERFWRPPPTRRSRCCSRCAATTRRPTHWR